MPVLLGSALRNRGVPALLDAVVAYLPSPKEKGAIVGRDLKTNEELAFPPEPDAALGALVFKTVHYPTGDLSFVRVYSGTFSSGEALYNPRLNRNERIGRLYLVHAKSRELSGLSATYRDFSWWGGGPFKITCCDPDRREPFIGARRSRR